MSRINLLENVSMEKLEKQRKKEKDHTVRDRLLALIMVKKGYPRKEISEILSTTKGTIWRWEKDYLRDDVKGLKNDTRSGRPKKIGKDNIQQLKAELSVSPKELGYSYELWAPKIVWFHIKEKYGVLYHPRSISRLARNLGFVLKKPRPMHYKRSEEERKEYRESLTDSKKT